MAPAILFYVIYLAGIVVFVNGATPGDWMHNAEFGALFGLFCYATLIGFVHRNKVIFVMLKPANRFGASFCVL